MPTNRRRWPGFRNWSRRVICGKRRRPKPRIGNPTQNWSVETQRFGFQGLNFTKNSCARLPVKFKSLLLFLLRLDRLDIANLSKFA